MVTFNSFDEAYYYNLDELLRAPDNVIMGYNFKIEDANQNFLHNPPAALRYNPEYYQRFFEWLMSGSLKTEDLIKLSPKAANFPVDYKGNSTAYGPRILEQIEDVIHDLMNNPDTRQACIMILDSDDQEVRKGRRNGETKMEYPCTFGLTFYIKDEELHCYTVMRSNNFTVTVCLDVYLFTSLQIYIADKIGYPAGSYNHFAINAHIVPSELERAKEIMEKHHAS